MWCSTMEPTLLNHLKFSPACHLYAKLAALSTVPVHPLDQSEDTPVACYFRGMYSRPVYSTDCCFLGPVRSPNRSEASSSQIVLETDCYAAYRLPATIFLTNRSPVFCSSLLVDKHLFRAYSCVICSGKRAATYMLGAGSSRKRRTMHISKKCNDSG